MPVVQLLAEAVSELGTVLGQAGFTVRALAGDGPLEGDGLVIVDDTGTYNPTELGAQLAGSGRPFLVVTNSPDRARAHAWIRAGAADLFSRPVFPRELLVRINAIRSKKTRVACVGGGTGLFTLLMGLKTIENVHLSSIVSVFDDGGSSGRLRSELGVLPPGDVRRSLVALSDAPQLMNDAIQHRFSARGEGGGSLDGHNLGNLILSALSDLTGGLPNAVRALGDFLHIRGVVLCSSDAPATLCAELSDGSQLWGESTIDLCESRSADLRICRLWQDPAVACTIDAYAALLNADLIVVGPGDLYTSVVANLVVDGIAEAIRESPGRCVYVSNVMTKPGETYGYSTADHVREIVRYLGSDRLDYVVASSTVVAGPIAEEYAKKGQQAVTGALEGSTAAELLSEDVTDSKGLVRHDSSKLARVFRGLLTDDLDNTVDLRTPLARSGAGDS